MRWARAQDPTGYDTIAAMNQILQPVDEIFRSRLAGTGAISEDARFFYEHYFARLFALYRAHADGQIRGEAAPSAVVPAVKLPVNL